jgi:hypothetical protein
VPGGALAGDRFVFHAGFGMYSISGRACPPKNLEGTKAIELTQAEPRLAQP